MCIYIRQIPIATDLDDVNTHIWFSLCLGPKVAIFSFSSFFFGRTKWLVGSQFPNQGSNLGSLQVKLPSPNHWIAREVPKLTIFSLFLQIPYKEHWRTPGMWMQGPAVKKRHEKTCHTPRDINNGISGEQMGGNCWAGLDGPQVLPVTLNFAYDLRGHH